MGGTEAPPRGPLDLARLSLFLDFDGTISVTDVSKHLLETMATPDWQGPDDDYLAGRIGSQERIRLQWACLPHDAARLAAAARTIALDPGLGPLVDDLRARGAELSVLSDGFGFYVRELLEPFGLDVRTNEVDFGTGEVAFPFADPACPCRECGTCKRAPVEEARRRGRVTAFVGDGMSDSKAAAVADLVFAKRRLRTWCEANGVAHVPFDTLGDVHRWLLAPP